jgi:hypothetical protein
MFKVLLFVFTIHFVLSQNISDSSTLTGKVVTGYQGWFATPYDGYNRGWFHYSHPKDPNAFNKGLLE